MSKNKKTAKNKKKQSVINTKNIIIAVAAVAAVAVIILIAVFVIKPAISNSDNTEATTVPVVTVKNEGTQHTYAEYKGAKLPVEFVEILNQMAIDSQAACEKYGVAMTIGDRKISVPEFLMYYLDEFGTQVEQVNYSIATTGENRTGFDTSVMPDMQKHLDDDHTWAEEFTRRAADKMRSYYAGFDMAVEAKTKLDVMTVNSVISYNDTIDSYAKSKGMTPEEAMESLYCEGVTPAMHKVRSVMSSYAQFYEYSKTQELYNGYTQEELEKEFNSDKSAYSIIKGRVYPIEGKSALSEIDNIKTEQDFLDFAVKNFPEEGYNAEIRTQCNYINKESVSNVFGPEVGEWMFDKSRKAGDIGVVEGAIFNYLVYVEKPAFLGTSRDIVIYINEYNEAMTDEDKKQVFDDAQNFLKDWKAGEATQQSFEKMVINSGLGEKVTARVGDYHYSFENWIYDSSRKSGDTVALDCEAGCCVIYYIGNNTDDYDWPITIRTKLSTADYKELYDKTVKQNHKIKFNDENIITAYTKSINFINSYYKKNEMK